jgi:hypothetical protein
MFDTSYEFSKIRNWRYVWYEDSDQTDANIIIFEPLDYPDNSLWRSEWMTYSKEGDNWSKNQKSIIDTNRFFGTMLKCTESFANENTEYSSIEIGPATTESLFTINKTLVDKLISTRNDLQKEIDSDRLSVYINKIN